MDTVFRPASLLALAALSAIAGPARALTLEEAVAKAQQHSPMLEAANAGVQAAEAGTRVARAFPNPTLSVDSENVLGSGPYRSFDEHETTAQLSMPLELSGKRRARIDAAMAERDVETIALQATRAEVTYRATLAFIEVAAARRQNEAAQERLQLARQLVDAAQIRLLAGKTSPIDGQRAEAQRIAAEIESARAARAANLAIANLSRLTGDAVGGDVIAPWFEDVSASATTAEGTTSLVHATAEAKVAAASARLREARRSRFPDLTVSVGTRRFGATGDNAAVLGISLPLPLLNSGGAEVARTRAEVDRATANLSVIEAEIEQENATARAELADRQAVATATRDFAMAVALEAARIARIGYAEGKFSQLDLIDAESALAATRSTAIDAFADFHRARAKLALLQGRTEPIEKDAP